MTYFMFLGSLKLCSAFATLFKTPKTLELNPSLTREWGRADVVLTWLQVSLPRKRVLADLMDALAWGKAIWKGLRHLAPAGMAYKPSLTPQDKGEKMPKGLHSR